MKKESNVIELVNIETVYEGESSPVIHDVNLEVKPGEFISVIGPNGAGKTTLLETINGLLSYNKGKGFVFGKEIKKYKSEIRKEIGYVIQNFEMDPLAPFLCKDIVMAGRTGKIGTFRFAKKSDWDKVWYSMGLVGMIDFANRPIGKLSGGEFQKILLSRALAQNLKVEFLDSVQELLKVKFFEILLLDEPFSNLDYASRKQVETLLNRIHEKNDITILIVSHDLSFVPSRCKRILVLDHGRIIMDGSREKILKSDIINSIFKENGGEL